MKRLLFAGIALALGACASSPPPPPKPRCSGEPSPDGALCAKILSVGKYPPPLDESQVDILNAGENLVASKSFKSPAGDNGRSVVKTAWTPNAKFFVFNTQSSGGHSPWHWQTYYYSKKANAFKELDDTTGPIIKKNFQVKAPDEVDVYVQGTPSDPTDINTGTLKVVHLGALP